MFQGRNSALSTYIGPDLQGGAEAVDSLVKLPGQIEQDAESDLQVGVDGRALVLLLHRT